MKMGEKSKTRKTGEISRSSGAGETKKTGEISEAGKTSERAKRRRRARTALLAAALGFAPFAAFAQTATSRVGNGLTGKFSIAGPVVESAPSEEKTAPTETASRAEFKAFLVGADDYDDAPKLTCVKNDVEAFAARLVEIGFDKNNVTVLKTGGQYRDAPTKANIEDRFAEFVASLKPGDFAVVFMSGHGLQNKETKEAFFAPVDLEPKKLFETAVSIDGMLARLEKSSAKCRWMIVDACRNVPAAWETSEMRTRAVDGATPGLTSLIEVPDSTILLQSCEPGKVSYEGGEGNEHGLFTQSLLEALDANGSKADGNSDGVLKLTELVEYVAARTNELATQNGGTQKPTWRGATTDFEILTTLIEGLPPERWRAADALYQEACALRRKREYRRAAEKLSEARKINAANEDYKAEEELIAELLRLQTQAQEAATARAEAERKAKEEAAQAEAAALAAANSAETFYRRGREAAFGLKGKIDAELGFHLLQEAANQGSTDAMGALAVLYRDGCAATPPNSAKALELMKKAADAENPWGQFFLAFCYLTGAGVEKDKTRADALFEAARAGFAELADEDPLASTYLGRCYADGRGGAKDCDEAARRFREAAETGCVDAMICLAGSYALGLGVAGDAKQAFEWYRKGAEAGNAYAMFLLGQRYEYWSNVEKDAKKAFEWYRKSAEAGYAAAMRELGWRYENGLGVEKDAKKAFEWYRKGAEAGYACAMRELGRRYENGYNVAENKGKAFEWYRQGAEAGNDYAMYELGRCYENGIGVAKDAKKAFEWYRKGAEAGAPGAMDKLGYCYENGVGAAKNLVEAERWYRKAMEFGPAEAINAEAGLERIGRWKKTSVRF